MSKVRHPEAISQRSVILWWAYSHKVLGIPEHLLFSVPNGGYRHPFEAKLLREEGMRSGVADLILLVPRGIYHGMALEMKSQEGRLSPEQKEWAAAATSQGYLCVVAYSTEEAIKFLTDYLRQQS